MIPLTATLRREVAEARAGSLDLVKAVRSQLKALGDLTEGPWPNQSRKSSLAEMSVDELLELAKAVQRRSVQLARLPNDRSQLPR